MKHIYIVGLLIFVLVSCKQDQVEIVKMNNSGSIQATIDIPSGDLWNSTDKFLTLPFNVGHVNDKKVIVIGKRIAANKKLDVTPIGAIKLLENDSIKTLILTIPFDIKQKTINVTNFNQFSTVYSSSKWIVEQYLVNRNGPNMIKLKSWENEKSAINYLLN